MLDSLRICRRSIALAGVLAITMPALSQAHANSDRRYSFDAGMEFHRWQEFDDSGNRLLTETGPRLVLAGAFDNLERRHGGLVYRARLRAYSGEVDYDGQDTNRRYVASTTSYRGWGAEFDAGWRVIDTRRSSFALDIFGGIGFEQWRRDIQSGINALGIPVQGLIEDYSTPYVRVGLGLLHYPGAASAYLDMGVRRPIQIDEEVVVSGELLTLNPQERWSGFVSYRISVNAMTSSALLDPHVAVYYETWRFGRSAAVPVGNLSVWQPESDQDVLGIVIGVSF